MTDDRILVQLLAKADAAGEIDWTVSVASTINRVHQHAANKRRPQQDAGEIHKSRRELVKRRPQADDKATLRQLYQCHVAFGYAAWLAGLRRDLEKARANKSNWPSSALTHKCCW